MPMELATPTFFSFQTLTFTSTRPAAPTTTTPISGLSGRAVRPPPSVETIFAETVVTLTIASVTTLDTNSAFRSIGTNTSPLQPSITPSLFPPQPGAISPSQNSTLPTQTFPPPSYSMQTAPFPTDNSSSLRFPASASRERKLAYILPAVFLPLLFACILAYIIYRRQRCKLSWKDATIIPITFETTDDQHLMTVQNNSNGRLGKFISVREPCHDAPANYSEVRDINGDSGGDRGATVEALPDDALQRNASTGNGNVILVTRAELLDLRIRLADAEARQVVEPPPYC